MKSSFIILSIIAISLSACSPNPLPPPVSPTVETGISTPPDSPAFVATDRAITKTAETESTSNNPYLLRTPTPNPPSNSIYESQIGLYNLVDELSSQLSRDEYNEFLELQDEWESLARRQCRWQAKFFIKNENSDQYSICLDKQYRQRIAILLVLICRYDNRDYYRANEDCPEAEKYKELIQQ